LVSANSAEFKRKLQRIWVFIYTEQARAPLRKGATRRDARMRAAISLENAAICLVKPCFPYCCFVLVEFFPVFFCKKILPKD
jgi:hypothetical protein